MWYRLSAELLRLDPGAWKTRRPAHSPPSIVHRCMGSGGVIARSFPRSLYGVATALDTICLQSDTPVSHRVYLVSRQSVSRSVRRWRPSVAIAFPLAAAAAAASAAPADRSTATEPLLRTRRCWEDDEATATVTAAASASH